MKPQTPPAQPQSSHLSGRRREIYIPVDATTTPSGKTVYGSVEVYNPKTGNTKPRNVDVVNNSWMFALYYAYRDQGVETQISQGTVVAKNGQDYTIRFYGIRVEDKYIHDFDH